jgi:methylated-DNA-[protein]-cysteine S-methyltransferase
MVLKNKKSFNERCYEILIKVPRGKVTTYGEIAKKLKSKGYRAVGNAMNKNPYAPRVPCHRVVNSNGEIGGFAHGTKKKIEMLRKEGIEIKDNRIVNFEKYMYKL